MPPWTRSICKVSPRTQRLSSFALSARSSISRLVACKMKEKFPGPAPSTFLTLLISTSESLPHASELDAIPNVGGGLRWGRGRGRGRGRTFSLWLVELFFFSIKYEMCLRERHGFCMGFRCCQGRCGHGEVETCSKRATVSTEWGAHQARCTCIGTSVGLAGRFSAFIKQP